MKNRKNTHFKRYLSLIAAAALLGSIFTPLAVAATKTATDDSSNDSPPLTEVLDQRQAYLAALKALRSGDQAVFEEKSALLSNYVLTPYLEYFALRPKLSQRPYQQVDEFLDHYAKTPIAVRLRAEWLDELAAQRRWHEYVTYYHSASANTERSCQFLWARLQTGDRAALNEVGNLWNVPHSQPNGCDPLFEAWMNSGALTADIAWQRFFSALQHRRYQLARYLRKQLPDQLKVESKLLWSVYRHPENIKNLGQFAITSPYLHDIILYGVQRYARRNAKAALYAWELHDSQQLFNDADRKEAQLTLALSLARQGENSAAETFGKRNNIPLTNIIEAQIKEELRQQNWQAVFAQIQRLPTNLQQEDRWLYWRARAMQQLETISPALPTSDQIFTELAEKRSFYGFLAADILGKQYSLVDSPVKPSPELVNAVAQVPALLRARELFALGEFNLARREWRHATKDFDEPAMFAAGKLAQSWNWYRKGIEAMINTKYWDDLELRFPLAYRESVNLAAASTQIPSTLLFAITRQESAFAHDARSPVGAMGLMQLMPATAKETARSAGVRYKRGDLLTPDTNIHLGSQYLEKLLTQFHGNRILATAAYNAGPYRVKQWLKRTEATLPYDIWIEIIPFKETRNYVQNVLAYSVIYGYRLGEPSKMINNNELEIAL